MGQLPASDPNAPVVPDAYLKSFRHFHEPLTDILRQLSDKLEKSINMYRHRRSPSASLVIKFQGMLTTLKRWNDFLGDDTFAGPTKVVDTWLNHVSHNVFKVEGSGVLSSLSSSTQIKSTISNEVPAMASNHHQLLLIHIPPPVNTTVSHYLEYDAWADIFLSVPHVAYARI